MTVITAPDDSPSARTTPAVQQASEAPVAPSMGPSGEALPVGNLPGWRQVFADGFDTPVALGSFPSAVSARWAAYPSPWKDTSGYGTNSPAKVDSIGGGLLTQHIHTEGSTAMVSAIQPKLSSTSPYGQLYGRYAVRFRTDPVAGYKMAWLLWPDSGQHTAEGEIDFPETNLDSPRVSAFVHHPNSTGATDQAAFLRATDMSAWHTAVVEWSPNLVVFRLDGLEMGRTTVRVPSTSMHWVLQTETALTLGAAPSPASVGDVQIDWVAAWAYDPSIVAAANPASYVPVAPARLLDSRPDGSTIDATSNAIGVRGAGTTTELQITGRDGIPNDASAATLNITATQPQAPGFVSVYPCGTDRPTGSNLNYDTNTTIANSVIAKIGTNGKVCIYTYATTQLIVDVNGYFPATANYTPLAPARILETRPDGSTIDATSNAIGVRGAGTTTELQITGRDGIPNDASAATLNITATQPQAPGFVSVYPCGTDRPTGSNLNYDTNTTIANSVIAKIGTNGKVCIYTYATTQLIVDVNGYFPATANYTPLAPARILETRPDGSTIDATSNAIGVRGAGTTTELQITGRDGIPNDASAATLNITATQPQAPGFVSVYPCGTDRPTGSNLNYDTNTTIANSVIAKIGTNGKVCIYTYATTQLIVDVNGYFPATA